MPKPPPPEQPPEPKLVLDIEQPADGVVLNDPQNVVVRVYGKCEVVDDPDGWYTLDPEVSLTLSIRRDGKLSQLQTKTAPVATQPWWRIELTQSGEYYVKVEAVARHSTPGAGTLRATSWNAFTINIQPRPTIAIDDPAQGAVVPDSPGNIAVRGKCTGSEPLAIKVTVGRDQYDAERTAPNAWQVQSAPLRQIGALSIGATVTDGLGRTANAPVRTVTVKDITAPTVSIGSPSAGTRVPKDRLTASGIVQDTGSGVVKVEWSLDGTTWKLATLAPDGGRWSVRESVTALGPVELRVRATDAAGNRSDARRRSFTLVEPVTPADKSDVTSRQSFLGDLLAYLQSQVKLDGQPLTPAGMEGLLFQSFGAIVGMSPRRSLAPVPEIRLAVGVLERYVSPNGNVRIAELRHFDLAYELLLGAIGTSLVEVGTAAAAPAAERAALAARLGFPASTKADGDTIQRLLLRRFGSGAPPEQTLSDATLNALFGYTSSPFAEGDESAAEAVQPGDPARGGVQQPSAMVRFTTTRTCLVTRWRAAKLLEDAVAEDNAAGGVPIDCLVVDPDIVCEPDLAPGDNPVRALLTARSDELAARQQAIVVSFDATSTENDRFAATATFLTLSIDAALRRAILDRGLLPPPAEAWTSLTVLRAAIELHRAGHTEPLFLRLLQIDPAGLEAISRYLGAGDRSDVFYVLVNHHKRAVLAPRWKAEEARLGLAVAPEWFSASSRGRSVVRSAFSSGVDGDGRPAAPGSEEIHWKEGIRWNVVQTAAGWLSNDAASQWIRTTSNAGGGIVMSRLPMSFSLRGFDHRTAKLLVRLACFGEVEWLGVNRYTLNDPPATAGRFYTLSLDDELVRGDNTMEVAVLNHLAGNLVIPAVRVQLNLTAVRSPRAAITARGSLERRIAWENKLLARTTQRSSLAETMAAACNLVDLQALPVQRDDLVNIAGAGLEDPRETLSRRLLIDVMCSATRMTTLAEYAGRSLQTLLHVLATGAVRDPALGGLSAVDPAHLSADALFLQSYDAWRAASLAFWYPENYLFPSLIEADQKFKEWLTAFVTSGASGRPTGLTDIADKFGYPVQIALARASQGEYGQALDSLATIYDYRAASNRKKWPKLVSEEGIQTDYQREPRWFSTKLNPHALAPTRRNAYTRFLLMTIARVVLDSADAMLIEGGDAVAQRARFLYWDAQSLLGSIPPPIAPDATSVVPDNPALRSLRARAETSIERLRTGLDIGGLSVTNSENLDGGVVEVGADGALRIVTALAPPPTAYRYVSLIGRAKELTGAAQQVEALYLASLKDKDAEAYALLRARQEAGVTSLQVTVADLRIAEADKGLQAVEARARRLEVTLDHYDELIRAGTSAAEQRQMRELEASAGLQYASSALSIAAGVTSFVAAANPWAAATSFGASNANSLASGFSSIASALSSTAGATSTLASIEGIRASHERRAQEWELQRQLAGADLEAQRADREAAVKHAEVARAEQAVAEAQRANALATVDFLGTKFTGVALYEFMSRVLAGVYRSLLHQATSAARLAERQLAFERQEPPGGIIGGNYWSTREGGSGRDFAGLTGSARLLGDIAALDQRAFDTNRRKLQLRKTLSLARLFPADFRRLRETGVLPFATPMELFDRDFPGHYLRLISSVKLSVAALVPPNEGLRGTLYCPGASRVVVQNGGFRTLVQRRLPETVAFTSPINATGLFDVDLQPEMLRPFEGLGVDTSFILELARAANPFDYDTLIDVHVTIEYTALHDAGYRLEMIRRLRPSIEAERTFSIRESFPDAWYALQSDDAAGLFFDVRESDVPANHLRVSTTALTLFLVADPGADEPPPELELSSLTLTGPGGARALQGARTFGGIIGTRRGNGASWKPLEGQPPFGSWEIRLPSTSAVRNTVRRLRDIVIVLSYRAELPEWPDS